MKTIKIEGDVDVSRWGAYLVGPATCISVIMKAQRGVKNIECIERS